MTTFSMKKMPPRFAYACERVSAHWRHPWLLAGAAAVLMAAVAAWFALDRSRVLSPREVEGLKSWSTATQSPEVLAMFEQLLADGRITVRESQHLAEVAKAAAIPPGLYEPVDLD